MPRADPAALRRVGRGAAAVALGVATSLAAVVVLGGLGLAGLLARPVPAARRRAAGAAAAAARALDRRERRRIALIAPVPGPATRPARFVLLRAAVGLPGGAVALVLTAGGAAYLVGAPVLFVVSDTDPVAVVVSVAVGLAAIVLGVQAGAAVALADVLLARRSGPDPEPGLAEQLRDLRRSRTEVVAAVDDERRRIERDLHDGVQQEVVALGLLLGRAARTGDPERATRLLGEAHDASQQLLRELRRVSWSVFPSALDDRGLEDALRTLAARTTVPTTVAFDGSGDVPALVRTAAYFVVAESVTNATKHADPTRIAVRVDVRDGRTVVEVVDDGRGGADADGGGLRGLRRRLAALDGTLAVASPAGGPTVVRAEIPCGS